MSLLQGIIDKNHILLLGIPHTRINWLGKILTATMDYSYVHEPDNEKHTFYGYYAKQGLARFPILNAQQKNKKYLELFKNAFYQPYITYDSYSNQILKKWVGLTPQRVEADLQHLGKNPQRSLEIPYIFGHILPKQLGNRNNRVVKSAHAILSADFLLSHLQEIQPVFIIRHPAAVVASLLRVNNQDIDRQLYLQPEVVKKYPQFEHIDFSSKPIEYRAGVQIAIFYSEIARLLKRHPKAQLVSFEDLANDPFLVSYQLYESLGMKWTDKVELFIANSNRKGTGYETRRETRKQATKWKSELDDNQIKWINEGYSSIGGQEFYQEINR